MGGGRVQKKSRKNFQNKLEKTAVTAHCIPSIVFHILLSRSTMCRASTGKVGLFVICEMNGGVAKTLNSVLCNYVRLSSSKMQRLVELLQDEARTPQSFKGTFFSSSPVWKLKLCYKYSFPTQKWLNVKKLFFNRYGINLRLCQIEF